MVARPPVYSTKELVQRDLFNGNCSAQIIPPIYNINPVLKSQEIL